MALHKIIESWNTRRYLNSNETVHQTISVTNTTLTSKIDVTIDGTTCVQDWTIKFSELSTIPRYNSNVLIGFRWDPDNNKTYKIYNMSLLTYPGRDKNNRAGRFRGSYDGNIQILVKNAASSFADAEIMVFTDNTYTLTANVQFNEYDSTELDIVSMLDDITVTKDTTYNNPEYIKYNISTKDYVDQISTEPLVGILDKSRVYLTNGTGSVRVLKSSIEDYPITFKVGFVNYPGLVTISE